MAVTYPPFTRGKYPGVVKPTRKTGESAKAYSGRVTKYLVKEGVIKPEPKKEVYYYYHPETKKLLKSPTPQPPEHGWAEITPKEYEKAREVAYTVEYAGKKYGPGTKAWAEWAMKGIKKEPELFIPTPGVRQIRPDVFETTTTVRTTTDVLTAEEEKRLGRFTEKIMKPITPREKFVKYFVTKLTPVDPLGLRTLYTPIESAFQVKTPEDFFKLERKKQEKITREAVEWIGRAGKAEKERPEPWRFVRKLTLESPLSQAGMLGVTGAGIGQIAPTVAAKVPFVAKAGKIISAPWIGKGMVVTGGILEGAKVSSMITQKYEAPHIAAEVSKDVALTSAFISGLKGGLKLRKPTEYRVKYIKKLREIAGKMKGKKEAMKFYAKEPKTFEMIHKEKPEIKEWSKVLTQEAVLKVKKGMIARKTLPPTEAWARTEWLAKPELHVEKFGFPSVVEKQAGIFYGRITLPIKADTGMKITKFVAKPPFPKTPLAKTFTGMATAISSDIAPTKITTPITPIVTDVKKGRERIVSKPDIKIEAKPISYKKEVKKEVGYPRAQILYPHELTISRQWAKLGKVSGMGKALTSELVKTTKFGKVSGMGRVTGITPKMGQIIGTTPIVGQISRMALLTKQRITPKIRTIMEQIRTIMEPTPSPITPFIPPFRIPSFDFGWPKVRGRRKGRKRKLRRRKLAYTPGMEAFVTGRVWKKFPKKLTGLEPRWFKKKKFMFKLPKMRLI